MSMCWFCILSLEYSGRNLLRSSWKGRFGAGRGQHRSRCVSELHTSGEKSYVVETAASPSVWSQYATLPSSLPFLDNFWTHSILFSWCVVETLLYLHPSHFISRYLVGFLSKSIIFFLMRFLHFFFKHIVLFSLIWKHTLYLSTSFFLLVSPFLCHYLFLLSSSNVWLSLKLSLVLCKSFSINLLLFHYLSLQSLSLSLCKCSSFRASTIVPLSIFSLLTYSSHILVLCHPLFRSLSFTPTLSASFFHYLKSHYLNYSKKLP